VLYAQGAVRQLDTVQLDTSYGSIFIDAETQLTNYRQLLGGMEGASLDEKPPATSSIKSSALSERPPMPEITWQEPFCGGGGNACLQLGYDDNGTPHLRETAQPVPPDYLWSAGTSADVDADVIAPASAGPVDCAGIRPVASGSGYAARVRSKSLVDSSSL
jgi:hypothetical protein